MAKRKQKRAITMIALLVLLAALIGVYAWYGNRDTKKDNPEDTKTISLAKVDPAKVTKIHYIGSDINMNFINNDGVWKSKEEPDRPINQDSISGMINNIQDISAIKVITESTDDLSNFGLDNPKPFVELTMEDGSTITLKLGLEAPTGDGLYAMVNKDSKVYLVDQSFSSALTLSELSLSEIKKAPDISPDNINYLNIDKRGKQNIELMLSESIAKDNSGFGNFRWQYVKPYGEGYTADTNEIQKIIQNYATFIYQGCVDYKGDKLAKYGLDKPSATITVGYYQNPSSPTPTPAKTGPAVSTPKISKRYTIHIGNKTDDGNYYVQVDGLKSVYLLSASTVEGMLNVDAFTLVNKYAAIPSVLRVDKITASVGDQSYIMDIKTTKSKDKDGKEVSNQTFKFNGADVGAEPFSELYRSMDAIMYDAPMDKKVDLSKLKSIMSISFHLTDDDTPVAATVYPYDDSFDIVDKGTGIYFLADKRKIQLIADKIKDFKPTK